MYILPSPLSREGEGHGGRVGYVLYLHRCIPLELPCPSCVPGLGLGGGGWKVETEVSRSLDR
jgi:hypothetical protein